MNKLVGSRSGTLLPAPDSGHLGNLYNFLVTDWCTANPFHRALPVKKSKCKMVDLCYTCCKFGSVPVWGINKGLSIFRVGIPPAPPLGIKNGRGYNLLRMETNKFTPSAAILSPCCFWFPGGLRGGSQPWKIDQIEAIINSPYRYDGRKTAEIWPISKFIQRPKNQKSITTKSQHHTQSHQGRLMTSQNFK